MQAMRKSRDAQKKRRAKVQLDPLPSYMLLSMPVSAALKKDVMRSNIRRNLALRAAMEKDRVFTDSVAVNHG
jgi:hypothetical protein